MFTTRFKTAQRALAGCAAACLVAGGLASAQQPSQYDLQRITQRLEEQDREIRHLRSRLDSAPQAEHLPPTGDESNMHSVSFADGDKKKDDKKDKKDDKLPKGMKKVDIITKPTYKIIGRVFADHLMIDQSDLHRSTFGDGKNRTHFRTARIGVEGDLYENVEYKFEVAFMEKEPNTDRPVAKDVYMTIKDMAYLRNVRIGHFKEPFSLDQLTSAKYITFMERNLADTFAPARNMGIMMYDHVYDDETLSWYTGIFRSEIDDDAVDENEDRADFSWTSRVAWNPFYDEPSEGRYFTHVGGSYSFREYGDNGVSYTADPEERIRLSDATAMSVLSLTATADNVHLFNGEAAMVYGPFHTQGEVYFSQVNGLGAAPDGSFSGFYAQAGYFLTGESRGYKKSSHAFDRVKILEPFFSVRTADGVCRGCGAWELKARYSYVDLNDTGLQGGRVEDYSAGVNWYLNSYCRMMLDYIYSQSEAAPVTGLAGGNASVVGLRAQVDW